MIQLPITSTDPEEAANYCRCRPICKSRRRWWRGRLLSASTELQCDRKPPPDCIRKWPKEVFPNGPCPLLKRRRVGAAAGAGTMHAVRVCRAPLPVLANTTYLGHVELAKRLGAWQAVRASCARCAVCACGACCACGSLPSTADTSGYEARDAERSACRRADMRRFDDRVQLDYLHPRIMYD